MFCGGTDCCYDDLKQRLSDWLMGGGVCGRVPRKGGESPVVATRHLVHWCMEKPQWRVGFIND